MLFSYSRHNNIYQCLIFCPTGCPTIVRGDCGTENTTLAATHMALRHNHHDELSASKSFRFGSSTTNTVQVTIY